MSDENFIIEIIGRIAEYARENDYDIDDTIQSVGNWLIALTSISTFGHYKEGSNEQND